MTSISKPSNRVPRETSSSALTMDTATQTTAIMDLLSIAPTSLTATSKGSTVFASCILLNVRIDGTLRPRERRLLKVPYHIQDFTFTGKLFVMGDIRNTIDILFQEFVYDRLIEGAVVTIYNPFDEPVSNITCVAYVCSLPLCPLNVYPTCAIVPTHGAAYSGTPTPVVFGGAMHMVFKKDIKIFQLTGTRVYIRAYIRSLEWTCVPQHEEDHNNQHISYRAFIRIDDFDEGYQSMLYHTLRNVCGCSDEEPMPDMKYQRYALVSLSRIGSSLVGCIKCFSQCVNINIPKDLLLCAILSKSLPSHLDDVHVPVLNFGYHVNREGLTPYSINISAMRPTSHHERVMLTHCTLPCYYSFAPQPIHGLFVPEGIHAQMSHCTLWKPFFPVTLTVYMDAKSPESTELPQTVGKIFFIDSARAEAYPPACGNVFPGSARAAMSLGHLIIPSLGLSFRLDNLNPVIINPNTGHKRPLRIVPRPKTLNLKGLNLHKEERAFINRACEVDAAHYATRFARHETEHLTGGWKKWRSLNMAKKREFSLTFKL